MNLITFKSAVSHLGDSHCVNLLRILPTKQSFQCLQCMYVSSINNICETREQKFSPVPVTFFDLCMFFCCESQQLSVFLKIFFFYLTSPTNVPGHSQI